MEWNRWPVTDAHCYPDAEFHQKLLRENKQGECLDLAMALRDQEHLFGSIKMKKLFPELIQSEEEEEEREEERRQEERRRRQQQKEKELAAKKARAGTWESFSMFNHYMRDGKEDEDEGEVDPEVEGERELTQEEREALARASISDANLLENYIAYERMFTMEMGGCREAGEAAVGGRCQKVAKGKGLDALTEEEAAGSSQGAAASNTCKQVSSLQMAPSTSTTTSTGTQRKENFVYGSLEPMKIITVCTFKIPTSFSARQGRIRNPGFYRRESQAVDTSDLGVRLEEMPVWEEVQASLLCSLEKEQRGHLIAERVSTDGLLQDEGTQTYSFLSAPFRRDTSLADLTAGKPLELHLQLQVESVTSRHHKASSAFTFLCGHDFQRREYGQHYKNVHSDIQMGVNGWFEQRCPLAYLGCTYSQKRFQPSTHQATVTYNENLGCFSLHPPNPIPPGRGGEGGAGGGGGEDSLSSLPYEVLCHMASFLDGLSLSQLALVSRLMRQVSSSLLQERGMVTLRWERMTPPHGGAKWRVKQRVWQFSNSFSPVDTWCFRDVASMSEHLKVCPHYERESRAERIRLPRVREDVHANAGRRGPTLVGLFQQKRLVM